MMQKSPLSRLWFLGRGCKQVPLDLTGGKILWAHPDGYFLSTYGNRLLHSYSPAMQGTKPYTHGANYPIMRHFGCKSCHILMCITFHGPRPIGYQCDHINGNKLDYRPRNLQWVTPSENARRASILREMRKVGNDPCQHTPEELLAIFHS